MPADAATCPFPNHVRAEDVLPYDFVHGPEIRANPNACLDGIRDQRAVFYSTFYGGFWVFTRYDDIRKLFQNHALLEQNEGTPHVPYGRKFIPLRLNPPEHIAYRRLMTPIFAPRQIAKLETMIRGVAKERLAAIAPLGQADFVADFALALPAAMFCGFVGFPVEKFDLFRRLDHDLIYAPQEALKRGDAEGARRIRAAAQAEIDAIVVELIAARRKQPGDDAISILLDAKVHDRPLTDDEILNMVTLLFFAGTDSTAGAIGYVHGFLAAHPAHKQTLIDHIDDEDFVWKAAEELLRFHAFHHSSRTVTQDAEVCGVQLKKGDRVVLPVMSANRDSRHFPDPLDVDFERKNANNHLTFGAGIHRCLGSHLATSQVRIALQEVHKTIPDYELTEPVTYLPGGPKTVPDRVMIKFTPRRLP
ncbi:MAG TPA: cytochrome P450 [Allosphingosinicella sp.]|nr:cytochrome P450 [Allosphingosinicella sp.]